MSQQTISSSTVDSNNLKQMDWIKQVLFVCNEDSLMERFEEAIKIIRVGNDTEELVSFEKQIREKKEGIREIIQFFLLFCIINNSTYREIVRTRCDKEKFDSFLKNFSDIAHILVSGSSKNKEIIYPDALSALMDVIVGYESELYVHV